MQNFIGLMPRSIIDEFMLNFQRNTQDYKRLHHLSFDVVLGITKIFEQNNLQIGKLMNDVPSQNLSQPYYKQILSIYSNMLEVEKDKIGNIQKQINENSSAAHENIIQYCEGVNELNQSIKTYQACEQSTLQIVKKYNKNKKSLLSYIEGYKNSFNDVKLIYNMNEKNKRYNQCENMYRAVVDDSNTIEQMSKRLTQKKSLIINQYKTLQGKSTSLSHFILKKGFDSLMLTNTELCKLFKKFIELINSEKGNLQGITMKTFFEVTHTQIVSIYQLALPKSFETNYKEEELMNYLKNFQIKIQQQKLHNKKLVQFQFSYFKVLERSFSILFKELLGNYQKNKKKMEETLPSIFNKEIKMLFHVVQLVIKIYEQLIKRVQKAIMRLNKLLEDETKNMKLLFKELKQNCEQLSKKQDKKYTEKTQFIVHLLTGIREKVNISLSQFKRCHNDILNDLVLAISEMQSSYTDNCMSLQSKQFSTLAKELQFSITSLYSFKPTEIQNSNVSFDAQSQKIEEFKKLKKPYPQEGTQKDKESPSNMEVMRQSKQSIELDSPSKKKTRYLQFLKSRITYQNQEKLLKTFTCALADKIILQGRLFVTSHRLCFYSNFNADNVFFGGTFIEVPKKDIIKLEKRKNGIFFDNSLSITTINGQVFLTSFFKRNSAFDLISQIADLNYDAQAYEFEQDDEVLQSADEVQVQAQDDIKQEQIPERAQKIQELLANYDYKECTSIDFKFQNMTAYKVFKIFYTEEQTTINKKKYPSFLYYFKKVFIDHKDISIGQWEPNVTNYFNSINFKNTCPIKATRKVSATIPVVKSPLPFMPKTAFSQQNQTVYLISKHKWIIQNAIETSGAPYTDCFRVYYKTVGQSNNEGYCKISSKIFVHFIKNTVMKSIIDSKSQEESSLQLNKMYNEYRKHIENVVEKKAKVKKQEDESDLQKTQKVIQNNKIQELEQEIEKLKEENEKIKDESANKQTKYKYAILGFIILYFTTVLSMLAF